jgi:hypothetical protein
MSGTKNDPIDLSIEGTPQNPIIIPEDDQDAAEFEELRAAADAAEERHLDRLLEEVCDPALRYLSPPDTP